MHTIHNARIQLLSTLLNTMAGASFAVGVAAPIAAAFSTAVPTFRCIRPPSVSSSGLAQPAPCMR